MPDRSDNAGKCPQCGKTVKKADRGGSLTAFLFQGSECSCNSQGPSIKRAEVAASVANQEFCPRCGLVKANQSRLGSLTGYLFQDTRCRCVEDEQFDSASMSQKFWRLKREDLTVWVQDENRKQASVPGHIHIDLAKGALIAGVYEIIKPIGSGGMGEVYLANHRTLDKYCALKVIPPEQLREVGWQRFQNEARVLGKLDHINIVRVFDLGIHDGCLPFYAMEYVEGQTLSARLAAKGRISMNEAIEIFKQVCDGVDFAHRNGVIHRDLKPANIMTVQSQSQPQPLSQSHLRPEKITVKLLDFGLAKLVQSDRNQQSLTAVGDIFGSPFYMSPEQCGGEKIDNRSDIYSTGCALFECLTGRPPFWEQLPVAVMYGHQTKLPPSLEDIVGKGVYPGDLEVVVAKLLRKNPTERYQTMAELKADLERLSKGEKILPYYVSRTQSPAPIPEREIGPVERKLPERSVKTILVCGLLTVVCGAALAYWILHTNGGRGGDRKYSKAILHTVNSHILNPLSRVMENYTSDLDEYKVRQVHGYREGQALKARSIKWDGRPFFKGIVQINGKSYKEWEFPATPESGLGTIETDILDRNISRPMCGRLVLPVGGPVRIQPNALPLFSPGVMKGFTDGNIDGLILDHLEENDLLALSKGLSKLKSITTIHIRDITGSATLDASLVKVVNQYPKLESIKISSFRDGKSWGLLRRLKLVESIQCNNLRENLDGALASFENLYRLKKLYLENFAVDDKTFERISTCKNLEELIFMNLRNDPPIEVGRLPPLLKLKNLKRLRLDHISYSEDLCAFLRKFSSLEKFTCRIDSQWPMHRKLALRQALPQAVVWIISTDEYGQLQQEHYPPLKQAPR